MKVVLRIQLVVVSVPDEVEIPDEKPGEGAAGGLRLMAHAVPAILRGVGLGSAFPGADPAMLSLSRNVQLTMSGDLKDLAEIAARFDQLATQIEADNLKHGG